MGENVQLNLQGYTIKIEGKLIILPKIEFHILKLFAQNPGKMFTREDIRREIWSKTNDVNLRTVDVHIYNLRAKISPDVIQTIQRKGYLFNGATKS